MGADAWGELLAVGALPTAVALLLAGALLRARRRRLAVVLASGAVVALAGMLVASHVLSSPLRAARRIQRERFAGLASGMSREEALARLGEPDRRCPGEGVVDHRARLTEEVRIALLAATRERWIYRLPGAVDGGADGCRPLRGDGEVGFDGSGRVIWKVPLTGESFLAF